MRRCIYNLTQTLSQGCRPYVGRTRHRNNVLVKPVQSSHSTGPRILLGGILSFLGLDSEKTEDDPITKSMKMAILNIQVIS